MLLGSCLLLALRTATFSGTNPLKQSALIKGGFFSTQWSLVQGPITVFLLQCLGLTLASGGLNWIQESVKAKAFINSELKSMTQNWNINNECVSKIIDEMSFSNEFAPHSLMLITFWKVAFSVEDRIWWFWLLINCLSKPKEWMERDSVPALC